MGSPVIYHGAGACVGPWPAAGGAPSVSMLSRVLWLGAEQFLMNAGHGQDNPPRIGNSECFPNNASDWFSRVVVFPQSITGGAWCQCSGQLPGNYDPAFVPIFRIAWYQLSIATWFQVCNWQIHWTVHRDGSSFGGGGPGVALDDAVQPTVPKIVLQYTPAVAIAATGGNAPPVAGDLFNVNVYRGAGVAGDVCMIGVEMSFRVIP